MKLLPNKLPVIALAAAITFVLAACETDIFFDEGHIHRSFDGTPEVGLFPVGDENPSPDDLSANQENDGTEISIEVQRINDHGGGNLDVHFSIDEELSTVEENVHYEFETSSPVSIPDDEWSADIEIDLIGGNITHGRDTLAVRIDEIDSDSDDDFSPAENFRISSWFIE